MREDDLPLQGLGVETAEGFDRKARRRGEDAPEDVSDLLLREFKGAGGAAAVRGGGVAVLALFRGREEGVAAERSAGAQAGREGTDDAGADGDR